MKTLLRGSFQDSDDLNNDLATCDVFVYSVHDRALKELAGEMFRWNSYQEFWGIFSTVLEEHKQHKLDTMTQARGYMIPMKARRALFNWARLL